MIVPLKTGREVFALEAKSSLVISGCNIDQLATSR